MLRKIASVDLYIQKCTDIAHSLVLGEFTGLEFLDDNGNNVSGIEDNDDNNSGSDDKDYNVDDCFCSVLIVLEGPAALLEIFY